MKISIQKEHDHVVITGVENATQRTLKIDRKVFETLESFTEPTPNGVAQTQIAEAMGVAAPGGRSGKAASFLERYTFGYGAFNGWCALLVATREGRKRFFQFNPGFLVPQEDSAPEMLTKQERGSGKVKTVYSGGEDLDIPDNYEATAEEINAVIDRAYILLGYDPANLSDEAPDLTYEEASSVVNEQSA